MAEKGKNVLPLSTKCLVLRSLSVYEHPRSMETPKDAQEVLDRMQFFLACLPADTIASIGIDGINNKIHCSLWFPNKEKARFFSPSNVTWAPCVSHALLPRQYMYLVISVRRGSKGEETHCFLLSSLYPLRPQLSVSVWHATSALSYSFFSLCRW